MKELFLILTVLHMLDGFQVIRKDPNCYDRYDHYCNVMSSDKCYLGKNSYLCCDTCGEYERMYSDLDTDVMCPFGDRDRECERMARSDCYKLAHRYQCCGTCGRIKTRLPDCQYGDHDSHACSKIKPYHCYSEKTRKMCCGTCNKYDTRREDCPYGDHLQLIEEKDTWYTCQAYVGHLGYVRCLPFQKNNEFREICCGSCHSINKRKYWKALFG